MKLLLFLAGLLISATTALTAAEQLTVITETIGGRPVPVVANRVLVRLRPQVTMQQLATVLPPGWRTVGSTFPIPADQEDARTSIRASGPRERLSRVVTVAFDGPVSPFHAVDVLRAKYAGYCDLVEPWYAAYPQGQPNDPMTSQQEYLDVISMRTAWNTAWGSSSVVIMINDNGVDQNHEDITGNIAVNENEVPNNGVDDDGNGFIDDHRGINFSWQEDGTAPDDTRNPFDGHGLEVAGLAAATWNNNIGISGTGGACRMFPIKTSPSSSGGLIVYGYQGIVYAALNDADVVNCSWGVVKPFSQIDQDVIDFALSMGTVVVGSAGNDGNELTNYPAAYRGVFGVGETTVNDNVTGSSSYGINADVFAPGRNALTTTSGNSYTNAGITGTSFAAPIGSGFLGLIRAKQPSLRPEQVIAFARQCVDDISTLNPQYGKLLSGRINASHAVSREPLATFGVLINGMELTTPSGERATRIRTGDTVLATFTILNALRPTTDLAAVLSVARSTGWTVELVDTEASIGACGTMQSRTVGPFRLVITGTTQKPLLLRLDFTSGSDECFDLWYMDKPNSMTTMANSVLRYSIGDQGQFGYSDQSDTRIGTGFQWKPFQLMNYGSGMMVCDSLGRVLSSVYRPGDGSDFTTEKSFTGSDSARGVLSDRAQLAPSAIGVEVEQQTHFPQSDAPVATIVISVRNISTVPLHGVSCAYFLDWDIGENGSSNRVESAPYALPPVMNPTSVGAAEAAWRDDVPAATVTMAYSTTPGVTPQAAGFLYNNVVLDGFTDEERIMMMSSGTNMQTTESGDVAVCVGMRFNGELAPGASRTFTLVLAADSTKEAAADLARRYVLNPSSVLETAEHPVSVYPQPVSDILTVQCGEGAETVAVVNMVGQTLRRAPVDGTQAHLHVSGLASGSYVVRVEHRDGSTRHVLITVVH